MLARTGPLARIKTEPLAAGLPALPSEFPVTTGALRKMARLRLSAIKVSTELVSRVLATEMDPERREVSTGSELMPTSPDWPLGPPTPTTTEGAVLYPSPRLANSKAVTRPKLAERGFRST